MFIDGTALELRASEIRQRLNEISGLSELNDETRAESDRLATVYADVETRRRATIIAEGEVDTRETSTAPDAETSEREQLRSRSLLVNYIRAALRGRDVDGAEAEYRAACDVDHGIPLALLGEVETRADAVSQSPSTVGVQMHPVQPMLFAPSIASTLGIDMPSQSSGTFATSTITTALTAGTKAKGTAAEATAAAMTVNTSTVKRISGRLSVREEDIATVGAANFEAALRQKPDCGHVGRVRHASADRRRPGERHVGLARDTRRFSNRNCAGLCPKNLPATTRRQPPPPTWRAASGRPRHRIRIWTCPE